MDTDLEIEYILIKTALDKMLYTIKLKYTDPPENPVIPESKLQAMKVLSDAVNMLNLLYGLLKENNKQFQEAKIKYLKDTVKMHKLEERISQLNDAEDF